MNKFLFSAALKFVLSHTLIFGIFLNSFAGIPTHFRHHSTKSTSSVPTKTSSKRETLVRNSIKSPVLRQILSNDTCRSRFKFVMHKLVESNLPKELALIPVIESEYNPKAISHKGAGGIWQLMPGTAKILGITNKQRFELAPSTKAALLYFKDLHREYGNWELAVAAYNAGDGRVNKALKRNPKAKSVQQLNLPHETKKYVKTFLSLRSDIHAYDS